MTKRQKKILLDLKKCMLSHIDNISEHVSVLEGGKADKQERDFAFEEIDSSLSMFQQVFSPELDEIVETGNIDCIRYKNY